MLKPLRFLPVLVLLAALAACDEDSSDDSDAGAAGSSSGSGGTSGAGGSGGTSGAGGSGGTSGADGAGSGGGGALGPTASVRVVNLVPGVTFDAWGPDTDSNPVRIATGIEYETISDYIEVPVNEFSQEPIFVLWATGEEPEAGARFSMLLENDHEHMRVQVGELDGPGERATIILKPTDPVEEAILAFETLDETEIERGDAAQANLHISYNLFDIDPEIVPSIGVVGEDCFQNGSTSVAQVFSLPAGALELGVFDRASSAECSELTALATHELDVAAGDNELVVIYLDGGEGSDVRFLSAPIAE